MSHDKPEPNEWVSPVMTNYLMECCDCGLVHEFDFKVVKFIGDRDADGFQESVDVEDKDVQVLIRARRVSDDTLVDRLKAELAASQAREMKLREALGMSVRFVEGKERQKFCDTALAQPTDTSALREVCLRVAEKTADRLEVTAKDYVIEAIVDEVLK